MIMFQNDYVEGAHPAVLKKLVDTNMEQSVGYGEDPYCEKARARIREAIGREDADVHFLVGGNPDKSDSDFSGPQTSSGSALCGNRAYSCA